MKIARLGAAAAFAGLSVFSSGCGKQAEIQAPPPSVMVAAVKVESLPERRTYVARVVAYDSVDLVARVDGYLMQRNFEEGSQVKKGDLLFLIEQEPYKAKLDYAQAALEEMEASLRDACIEYDRNKTLYEKNAKSKSDFDTAEKDKLVCEAKVLAAKATLQTAKINYGYTEIRAPFDGRMGMSNFSVGNLVSTSSGALATIVRNDLAKVDFYVSENLVATYLQTKVIVGEKRGDVLPRLILPNGGLYPQTGAWAALDNIVQRNTGAVLVRSVFPNPEHLLLPGMYVKVLLENNQPRNELLIPLVAVQEDQQGDYVMKLEGGDLVNRANVVLGDQKDESFVIVKDGLSAGDSVVVAGLQKIRGGMKVAPSPEPSASKAAPGAMASK